MITRQVDACGWLISMFSNSLLFKRTSNLSSNHFLNLKETLVRVQLGSFGFARAFSPSIIGK